MPPSFAIIEFCMNQVLMNWKHIAFQYIFTAFYALMTLIWQQATKPAVIFPGVLDWTTDGSLFDDCILWFIVFAGVQTGCFSLLLLLHYTKSRYCCRRSVPIIQVQFKVSDVGGLTSKSGKRE